MADVDSKGLRVPSLSDWGDHLTFEGLEVVISDINKKNGHHQFHQVIPTESNKCVGKTRT